MARRLFLAFVFMSLTVIFTSCGGGGGGSDSGDNTGNGYPTVPTGLTATTVSSTQIDLTWNASSDNTGIGTYFVYQGGNSPTASYTTYTSFENLTPGTRYCFSVSAIDLDGNESPASNAVCATTQSSAAGSWVTVRQGTEAILHTAVWTGTKLVVGGEATSVSLDHPPILTSADGHNWTRNEQVGFGFTDWIDMIYTGSRFVAISVFSDLYTSNDNISWTRLDSVPYDFSTSISSIAWSAEYGYVIVGSDGQIFTSSDLLEWTQCESGTTESLFGVKLINGRFIAVGNNNTILNSTDGITWSKATTPTPGSFGDIQDVAWNGKTDPAQSRYVAIGASDALVSADGLTWTAASFSSNFLESVVWSDTLGFFTAVGMNGAIMTSSDGNSWVFTAHTSYPDTGISLNKVVWTGTRLVAVGEKGTVLYSDDGATWTTATMGNDFYAVAWDGAQFIAVGNDGQIVVAPNTTDWTYRYLGGDYSLYDLVRSDSLYLAVGDDSTFTSTDTISWSVAGPDGYIYDGAVVYDGEKYVKTTRNGVATWDGVTYQPFYPTFASWKNSLSSTLYPMRDIVWTGNQFVVVGDNGQIYTSPDATETSIWTSQTSNVTQHLHALTWSGTQYVAVGNDGIIVTSPDAQTWTVRTSGTTSQLNDIVWTGTKFIAVGNGGTILTSSDGSTWSKTTAPDGYYLNGICWTGTKAIIVGDEGLIIRSN